MQTCMEVATLAPIPSLPWVPNVVVHRHGSQSLQTKENAETLLEHNHVSNINNNVDHIIKPRTRPAMLVLPKYCPEKEFIAEKKKIENVEAAIQGKSYCIVSKKGRRENMEDRYKVITDIKDDPNQAFFSVIDGHGGEAAADYVAENLGKNIIDALENNVMEQDKPRVDEAIRGSYLETDKGFLNQGMHSGACAASVLIRKNELHVANVGDCRVVLSRRNLAARLTNDHNLSREDERSRVENSGGFVHSCNGVWRVQGSLAVSRAIGDLRFKEWIISEPEIHKVSLSSDCDFLIMASDGLWDKVRDQEAVDVVAREEVDAMEACKKLVDLSTRRGNKDDITVIVINLQKFMAAAEPCAMIP